MKRAFLLAAVPLFVSVAGCGGWFTLDGFDAEYVSTPANVEAGTRYSYKGAVVIETADHQFYRQHEGRWVHYRERPRDLGEPEKREGREGDHREGDHREGDRHEGDHREGDHREGDHR